MPRETRRPDIEAIKANLKAGAYGSMCKACTDRLAQLIAYIERLENDLESRPIR